MELNVEDNVAGLLGVLIKRLHNIKIELTPTGLLKEIIEMMGFKINTGCLGCILVVTPYWEFRVLTGSNSTLIKNWVIRVHTGSNSILGV